MKNSFSSLLTEEEQKVIFFILIFAFIGITVRYSGLTAENDPDIIDSLVVMQNVEIKFDLTTVTVEELMSIPGIGSKRATDIINFRNTTGFQSRYDLLKIKGIGKTSLNKILNNFYEMEGDSLYNNITEASGEVNPRIDLNKATVEELCQLSGIGPSKAEKIIVLRQELGGFSSLNDILQVKGIGSKTLEKIKSNIFLGE
jgi:competence ComEA-like helix-hairpin-helix protein